MTDTSALTRALEIARLWEVHQVTERELTRLSLLEVLDMIEDAAPNTVTQISLSFGESFSWTFTVDDDDAGIKEIEAYDVEVPGNVAPLNLADELWNVTPSIWERAGDLLTPYTETGYVEIDKHYGIFEGAVFTPERIRTPHTAEEVKALEEARRAEYRRLAEEARERYRSTNPTTNS